MDLHLHSIYSDGQLTPLQIIKQAKRNRVSTISITDHDEIKGYFCGLKYASSLGIKLIPGIEINTENDEGELHILGYNFNPGNSKIHQHVKWRKKQALNWGEQIIRRLDLCGYSINWDSFIKRAQGGVINRTHIAYELISQGYLNSFKDAYTLVLREAQKVEAFREPFTAKEAIQLVHQAGGEAFLAHPAIYPGQINVDKLARFGLDGIEVFYPKNTQAQTKFWISEAQRLGLKISGGSDYHGPDSKSSYPIGSVQLPSLVYEQWDHYTKHGQAL